MSLQYFYCGENNNSAIILVYAGMVKLVDTADSKSAGATLAGSSPAAGIDYSTALQKAVFFLSHFPIVNIYYRWYADDYFLLFSGNSQNSLFTDAKTYLTVNAMGAWINANITLPRSVTLSEEKENAVSHFIGLFLAIIGFMYVLASSSAYGHPEAKIGMIIFAISNIVLYAASAFYHYLEPGTVKKALRVLDHSSIYILIAGSYTPILLYIGDRLTIGYAIGIWAAAIIGIVLTIRFWGRFYPVHIALYVVMGWSVLSIYSHVFSNIPAEILPYALTGGIIYTLGVIFYSVKKIPHNHLIWHFFVIGGSLSFFIGYCRYLLA